MKSKFSLLAIISLFTMLNTKAQNIFPSTGNAGAGTTTPVTTLQVIGSTRMGGTIDYAQVSTNGVLSFSGLGNYIVGGNKYVFQYSGNTKYALFFNSTLARFEFRDANANPFFYADAITKGAVLQGGLQIGTSSNAFAGTIRWTGTDFEGYTGSAWKSFTTAISSANTSLSNLSSSAVNVNLLPDLDNTRDLGYTTKSWRNAYIDGSYYLQGYKFISSKDQNVFVGRSTGAAISTGTNNTFTGSQSGVKTTTGSNNSFFGYTAGNINTTGTSNTFIGASVAKSNTTGGQNTIIGAFAGSGSGTGMFNTYIGYQTGTLSGDQNIGIGESAAALNSGSSNIFIGSLAGYFNEADDNIFIGSTSGWKNTIGGENVFLGNNTGVENTTGGANVFIGDATGEINTSGFSNTFLGRSSGHYNTSGSGNTFLGDVSGYNNSFGDNNTYIGSSAGGSSNWNNSIALGFDAEATASNQVRIGNSTITSIGGFVGWTKVSDGRFKKNIKENIPGLDFINKLRPVTYNLDQNKIQTFLSKNNSNKTNESAIATNEKILHTGFIAQEVDSAAKSIGYDFDGVDIPKDDKDYYGIRYAEFVVPLVKAVQELSKENDALKETNNTLEKRLEKIEQLLLSGNNKTIAATINGINVSSSVKQQTIVLTNAKLDQNIPNPAGNSTIIKYYLPDNSNGSAIKIFTITGTEIKSIPLNGSGAGQLNLQTNLLAAGTYNYSLIIGGKMIDSKKMIIIK